MKRQSCDWGCLINSYFILNQVLRTVFSLCRGLSGRWVWLAVAECCCGVSLNLHYLLWRFTQKASHFLFLPHQCKCPHQYGSSSSSVAHSVSRETFTPLWHKQKISTDFFSCLFPRRDVHERPFCFHSIIQTDTGLLLATLSFHWEEGLPGTLVLRIREGLQPVL